MNKVSVLCITGGFFALTAPACDVGSGSQTGSTPLFGADAGDGYGEESAAGASGEGGAAGSHATDSTTECERLSVVQCKQFYACYSAAELASSTSTVGTTETDCVALYNAANCVVTSCPYGETYMPGNMDRCVRNFAALSCPQFAAIVSRAAVNPPGCNSICE